MPDASMMNCADRGIQANYLAGSTSMVDCMDFGPSGGTFSRGLSGDGSLGLRGRVRSKGVLSAPPTTTTSRSLTVPTPTSLIGEIVQLQDDGAMPGPTEELRFAKTAVLGLALLQADVEGGAALYATHRQRIADYLQSKRTKGDKWMTKFIDLLRAGTAKVSGDWIARYQSLVGADKMGTPEKHEDYVAVLTDARTAAPLEV